MSIYGNDIINEGFIKNMMNGMAEKYRKKKIEMISDLYNNFIRYIDEPYTIVLNSRQIANNSFSINDIGFLLSKSNIPESKLMKKILNSSKLNSTMKEIIDKNNSLYDFISDIPIKLIQINMDESIFYTNNKFYSCRVKFTTDVETSKTTRNDKIQDISNKSICSGNFSIYLGYANNLRISDDMDILKQIDIEKGYYLFSNPPKGTTPKKLPL